MTQIEHQRIDRTLPGCGPLVAPDQGHDRGLRAAVFDRIRAAGLIPRVDLARDLAISPATITTLTSDLIERGLVGEIETPRLGGESPRGRPPVALGVRGDAGYVAGIKISDETHTAVILDFAGRRVAAAALPAGAVTRDLARTLAAASAVLKAATDGTGLRPRDLKAVGIGLPGLIDTRTGDVLWSPLMRGGPSPLGTALSAQLGCPVHVDNDANLVTLAELWFGAGRTMADFAVVTIEHGVGMGLVLNHRLYRGAHGMGMEIGHTKVQLDGALCRCGQRGCLEAYVADYALVREASTALNWNQRGGSQHELLEGLYEQAKSGDVAARMIFDRAGRYLALGLANIVNLFDPSLIILSGERMRYDYLYASEMLAEVARLSMNAGGRTPRIEINAWGDMVWAQGAAALALAHASDAVLAA